MTFGRALFYLKDRDAFESFLAAVQRAERLADRVLGPVQDAFTEAEQREADWLSKTGGVKPGTPKALAAEEIRSALVLHDQGLDPDTIAGRLGLDTDKLAASSTAPRRNQRWVRPPAGDRTPPQGPPRKGDRPVGCRSVEVLTSVPFSMLRTARYRKGEFYGRPATAATIHIRNRWAEGPHG